MQKSTSKILAFALFNRDRDQWELVIRRQRLWDVEDMKMKSSGS